MLESTFGNYKAEEMAQVPSKSAWEVAVEYITLTFGFEKPIEGRINDLKAYFSFYGYIVEDCGAFKEAMGTFFKEAIKTEKIIEGIEEHERKFRLASKEEKFKEMQEIYKSQTDPRLNKEPKRKSLHILNRPVTLLLSADEKIEAYETIRPTQAIESQLERMKITEFPVFESDITRRTSTSVYLKRSKPKLESDYSAPDNFTEFTLKVIFSYLDYGLYKLEEPSFIVVGNFAILVIEVIFEPYK